MIVLAFASLFAFSVPAFAAAQSKGYVVKADAAQVWLDLTAADGAAPGRGFQIYEEGEDLKHPVTGEQLGKTEKKIVEGKIEEVSAKHSLGRIAARLLTEPSPLVRAGQRARLTAVAAAPTVSIAPTAPVSLRRPGEAELRAPKTRGESLPYTVAAMALGDFDASAKPQIVLSDEKSFKLYAYPAAVNKPLVEGEVVGTGVRIVSLEAADIDRDKKSELFVSVYNEPFRRLETSVYTVDGGKWVKTADLPFLVRAHQDPKGGRIVAGQQIQDDKSFPWGAIYPLVFKGGRYEPGRPAIKPKRVDWLYGFTYAQLDDGEPALLYLTSVNSLRAQFRKGHWRSPESFGQSPVRVRWYDHMLEFHPPMVASYGDKGFETFYIVRNLAMLGGLANPFGLFNGGELHAKTWTGVAFETAWKAELGGSSQGIALTEPETGRKELVVAIAGSTGKSAVWTFDP